MSATSTSAGVKPYMRMARQAYAAPQRSSPSFVAKWNRDCVDASVQHVNKFGLWVYQTSQNGVSGGVINADKQEIVIGVSCDALAGNLSYSVAVAGTASAAAFADQVFLALYQGLAQPATTFGSP